ncbi:unnamed protein product, partial [Rotaria magnacalcarata]
RKEHTFHWQYNHSGNRRFPRTDFKSVEHIYACGRRAVNNNVTNSPNVTELIIKTDSLIYYDSMLTALNQIIPLKQLKTPNIDCNDYPMKEFVNLTTLTPNLRALKWNFQSIDCTKLKLIQQRETF